MNDLDVSEAVRVPPTAPATAAPTAQHARGGPGKLAYWIAIGFGSGRSHWAPGTVATLWAWVAFALLAPLFSAGTWGMVLVASAVVGWWACTRTAQQLGASDPSAIVWDEVLAFWLVLWLVTPASLTAQTVAFALFRFFDASKWGPVGWADRLFHIRGGRSIGWRQGFGILFDDIVAAGCTLFVYALGVYIWTLSAR